jgi:hypothetical protein
MKTRLFFPLALLGLLFLSACSKPSVPSGELFVSSVPEGSIVEVNGKVLGTTPLQRAGVPAGELLVVIRRDGFETEHRGVSLNSGGRVPIEVNLRPIQGLVLIDSTPPGAAVTIGDVFAGNTPLALHTIRLGTHRAKLVLSGFRDKEVEFSVEDRIPQRLTVDMSSTSGRLVVDSTPIGASVFVDGRNEGVTPISLPRVPEGQRDLVLQMPGFEPYRSSVLISPGDTAQVTATLNPMPGSLSVVSIPNAARIYINGEFKGEAPVNLPTIAPGAYNLRAEIRGHAEETRTVNVARGASVVEEFRLERNSGILQIVTRPAGVRVNINGEFLGTTQPRDRETDVVSQPLQIDMLSQGTHTLQLVRQGYSFETKRIVITKDQVTALDETLRRLFIPNTIVKTGAAQDNVKTGVLVRRHINGDVELETREGIFLTIPANEIVSIEPLKQEERIEPTPVPAP